MATRLRRLRTLLAGQASDQIPTWLLWPGVILSVAAIVYGVVTDWEGFLLNVAAGLALLWASLLIGYRLLRWWGQRPLEPVVMELPLHLRLVLQRLLEEATGVGAGQDRAVLDAIDGSGTPRERLARIGADAATLARELEQAAGTRPTTVQVQEVPAAELSLGRAVEHLGGDLGRFDGIVPMVDSRQAYEKLQLTAQKWEAFRGVPTAGTEVLLAARDVAGTVHTLAGHLVVELPRSLTSAPPSRP
jgi:hypothetical protein